MKKIVGILLSLSFVQLSLLPITTFAQEQLMQAKWITSNAAAPSTSIPKDPQTMQAKWMTSNAAAPSATGLATRTPPKTTETTPTYTAQRGITMNPTCLRNGQCKFNIYEFLGIRQDMEDASNPGLFVQDIILAATFFIGTIVTIGIIVSGLMYISAGISGKEPTKAKAGLKNSIIGLLIVVCSYSIIRLVQYIAKGV